jgi:hypothetical protein
VPLSGMDSNAGGGERGRGPDRQGRTGEDGGRGGEGREGER